MKNKKGFTLIELLAVIVILAIIALIATPIILNMIENAKKGAAKDSAYGYIEAIDFQNSMSGIDSEKYKMVGPGEDLDVTTLNVKVKGSKPENGKITIDSSGRVTSAELCINNYTVTYDGKIATTGTKCGESEKEDEVVYVQEPILEKAKALVYTDGACKIDGTTYNYMGGCYIKGNSETNEATTKNYVWYNGFMWRIMGINSDDTVRLITDENVISIPYGSGNDAETYTTNEGYINDWLTDYFYKNLNGTKTIINEPLEENIYFCSEKIRSSIKTDTVRTECTNEKKINTKIGMISIDEYYLAGQSLSYLNIAQSFWTMTPYDASRMWYVYSNGFSDTDVTYNTGVRPVINVASKSIITKGDGTSTNYYVLVEDKINDKFGTIKEIVTTGEYVKLENNTYRVVSEQDDGIKLILDGYVGTSRYGNNYIFTTTTGIGLKLNDETDSTSVINILGIKDKIKETTWYQGDILKYGFKYLDVLNSTNNPVVAKVGLIRAADILSVPSSTMLTKNYTTPSSLNNVQNYWLLNKNSSCVWHMIDSGYAHHCGNEYDAGVRPVIVVDSTLPINGGTGTWDNPYQI